MKVTIVLVGLFAVFGASLAKPDPKLIALAAVPYEQRIFEDVVNATLNAIISQVAKFDPISINHQEAKLLGHEAEIQNVQVAGFSNIVASEISISGLLTWKLKLVIDVPKVRGSVEHWKVDGALFYGDGSGSFEMDDLKITVTGKINPLSIAVTDLLITPSIGRAEVVITGIYNDEELSQQISNVINVLLNDVINNNVWLHEKISEIVQLVIDTIIGSILG